MVACELLAPSTGLQNLGLLFTSLHCVSVPCNYQFVSLLTVLKFRLPIYRLCRLKAFTHDAISSDNLLHITDIVSCECKHRNNVSQRNEVVTTCRSHKLSLQIVLCELAFKDLYPVEHHKSTQRLSINFGQF